MEKFSVIYSTMGPNGNRWVADQLLLAIQEVMKRDTVQYINDSFFVADAEKILIEKSKDFFNNIVKHENEMMNIEVKKSLDSYLEQNKEFALCDGNNEKTGCIVMNYNPFTYGHRYLIQQASQQVSRLLIFIVEENKSIFDFHDRIELVKRGCEDLTNVSILANGKFMISDLKFPEYFMKEELKQSIIDPSLDLSLFYKYIAPNFNISIRFVGDELFDMITKQYNESMVDILEK